MDQAQYDVVVGNVTVAKTKADGTAWDPPFVGEGPDLFCCVGDDSALTKSTSVADNLAEHTFDETLDVALYPGDYLEVTICDRDIRLEADVLGRERLVEPQELISRCAMQLTAADLAAGELNLAFGSVEALNLALNVAGDRVDSITVGRLKVADKRPDGSTWDVKGYLTDLPDLTVRLRKLTNPSQCTATAANTWSHKFNEELELGFRVGDRVRVVVSDKDLLTQDDLIGETGFVLTADDLANGKTLAFGSVTRMLLSFKPRATPAPTREVELDVDPRV